MEENEINSIIKQLEEDLEGKTVRHIFEDDLHQFIIEGGGLSFYIYIHPMFIEDEDPNEVLNELYKYNVIDTLKQSTESVWLYLSISGLREVNENFINEKPT